MSTWDAVVIGGGAGGLFAAACLVNAGKSVLVIEDHDRLGGRATSYEVDGFTINTGAIALKKGGVFEEILAATGVEYDVRVPNPRTVFRVDGKILNAGKGGLGLLLSGISKSAAAVGVRFAQARNGELPEAEVSTKEWLNGFTKNKTVHGLFRNLCAVLFSTNPEDLPARTFLSFFARSAAAPIAFCPRGTIGVWNDLADGIRAKGGEIRLNTRVTRILIEDGIATGVIVEADGAESIVAARTVISDAGVIDTISLAGATAMGDQYVSRAERTIRPTTIFNIYLASQREILETPALITLANTDSLCLVGDLTATCPELAPPGWRLYVAYSVPKDSAAPLDTGWEIDHALAELRREYPAFEDARLLAATPMTGDWPGSRTRPGYSMPQETPIQNLWNVGDSVKHDGDGGTQACAHTGKRAAEMALAYLTKTGLVVSEGVEPRAGN